LKKEPEKEEPIKLDRYVPRETKGIQPFVEDIPEDLKKKRPDKKRERDMEDFDIHFEKHKKRKFIPFDKNNLLSDLNYSWFYIFLANSNKFVNIISGLIFLICFLPVVILHYKFVIAKIMELHWYYHIF